LRRIAQLAGRPTPSVSTPPSPSPSRPTSASVRTATPQLPIPVPLRRSLGRPGPPSPRACAVFRQEGGSQLRHVPTGAQWASLPARAGRAASKAGTRGDADRPGRSAVRTAAVAVIALLLMVGALPISRTPVTEAATGGALRAVVIVGP